MTQVELGRLHWMSQIESDWLQAAVLRVLVGEKAARTTSKDDVLLFTARIPASKRVLGLVRTSLASEEQT